MYVVDTRTKTPREIELAEMIRDVFIRHRKAAELEAAPLIEELTEINNKGVPQLLMVPE